MSKRLNQDREKELQPQRMVYAATKIGELGLTIIYEDETTLKFIYKDEEITIWPYSGWFSGKGVKQGRGIENLLKQLHP